MADWYDNGGALNIQSGAELERFSLGAVKVRGVFYEVLTGYELEADICWWCGKTIVQGKREAHYCRGKSRDDFTSCFREYHRHFDWAYAATWAIKRAEHKCANCGCPAKLINWGYRSLRSNLEVHHIVPLIGNSRIFTAFNLPWNLLVLCRECHLELHSVMRPPPKTKSSLIDSWEYAEIIGQGIMPIEV